VSIKTYIDSLRADDQRAIEIAQTAAAEALALARGQQNVKDELANGLRQQIASERGLYASKDDLGALEDKLSVRITPISEFMISQLAAGAGIKDYRAEGRSEADLSANQRVAGSVSTIRANIAVSVSVISGLVTVITLVLLIVTHKI
jgi:hypothetical protein